MNRIKELRNQRGWLQSELAEKLSVSRQAISHYETEFRQLDPETIGKLCKIFECTADYLLGFSAVARQEITDREWLLLDAYNRATLRDRDLIDRILAAYVTEEKGEEAQ